MVSLCKIFNKINIIGKILYDEPLKKHSTFKIGGNADAYAVPADLESVLSIIKTADNNGIPLFIIGAGANILFSDSGFRGIVVDLSQFNRISADRTLVTAGAGTEISYLAELTLTKALAGLHYFYGMPGQVGGSIYMNARCYGASVSDVLSKVVFINPERIIEEYAVNPADFGYKISPFQNKKNIIVTAEFKLTEAGPDAIDILKKEKAGYKKERIQKGHYQYPCAGSVFKNNRKFGKPTGAIIDSLGLRGFSCNRAMVSPLHANIIVNSGNAAASDVKKLIETIQEKVFKAYGYELEREIIYIDES